MADRTPVRGSRTGRLQGKPYDRPDGGSAASSRNGSPAPQNRGFLSSVADMLFSPFSAKTQTQSRSRMLAQEDDQEASSRKPQLKIAARGDREKQHDEMDVEGDERNIDDRPIQPIREALASFAPVDPLRSIHLINDFNRAKKALDQRTTSDERRQIEELIRRADIHSPAKTQTSGLRGAASSATLRSPSRLARSRVLAKESGLSKSSSMNFSSMQREEQNKPTTPLRKAWKAEDDQEPSPPGRYSSRPMELDGLPVSAAPSLPAVPTSPYPSGLPGSSLRTSTSRYSLARPAAVSRFSSQRSSGLSKSQSMFSLPKASGSAVNFPAAEDGESRGPNDIGETGGRQRANALVGPTKPNALVNQTATVSVEKAPKSAGQKTAAAQELEDMLKQADEEEGRKSEPAAPIVNPYENYRFNVGASSPRKRSTATDKRAGGLAGRRALLAAAEKKEKERLRDTEMTDLDLIKENMADNGGKKRRVKESSSPEIQAIDPPKSTQSRNQAPTKQQLSTGSGSTTRTQSQTTAAPKRGRFSFGPPADDDDQPESSSVPTSSFTFARSSKAAPPPQKNDALDIIMANAGAGPASSAKLTPAVFPTLPTQEVPVVTAAVKDKQIAEGSDKRTAKDHALGIDAGALPVFVFKCLANVPSLAAGCSFAAQQKAKAVPTSELPSYSFGGPSRVEQDVTTSSMAKVPAKDPAPSTGLTGFTGWGAAPGASTVKSNDTWTCKECFLQSKATSTECDICEAPRPGHAAAVKPAAATGGFTGWGASFTPPATIPAAGGEWTCTLCGCKSKATSTQCDVCETPK